MTSWTARLSVRGLLQSSRCYSRKVVRTPLRVLSDAEDSGPRGAPRLRPSAAGDASRTPPVGPPPLSPSPSGDDGEAGAGEEPVFLEGKPSRLPPGFPRYEVKGNDDSDLSRLALDSSCPKKRQQCGLIMLEGKRLIQEAFNANLKLKGLFFSQVQTVVSLQLPSINCTFQKLTYKKMKRWSKVVAPSGLIGFFERPDISHKQSISSFPFSIICDNVRDPGNLGSILRVAASAGCREVLLTKGCVDLWNEKVLRSAMGSHFHMSIKENVLYDEIRNQIEPDAFIVFADNKDTNSEDVDDEITFSELDKSNTEYTHPSGQSEVLLEHANPCRGTESQELPPIFPYYEVAYSQMKSIYLVVGGETKGLSSEAFTLAKPQMCIRVNIPMLNNVESLNVTSALAILAHEVKRQFELFGGRDDLAPSKHIAVPFATT